MHNSDAGSQNIMSKKDVTNLIERLEKFEQRAGVRLEALSAFAESDDDGEFTVTVRGVAHSMKGEKTSLTMFQLWSHSSIRRGELWAQVRNTWIPMISSVLKPLMRMLSCRGLHSPRSESCRR